MGANQDHAFVCCMVVALCKIIIIFAGLLTVMRVRDLEYLGCLLCSNNAKPYSRFFCEVVEITQHHDCPCC